MIIDLFLKVEFNFTKLDQLQTCRIKKWLKNVWKHEESYKHAIHIDPI